MAGPITKPGRRNLTLGEKLQVIRFLDRDFGIQKAALRFNIGTSTVQRIKQSREFLLSQHEEGLSPESKRQWKAKHPIVDEKVNEFVCFVRAQRLPVTLGLIQERAKMTATAEGITEFKASRGWIQKFLRRNKVQPSFKLHGKGDAAMPPYHAERMEEIRQIASQYNPRNIYNQDESGLLYRMGPSRTYLTADEPRAAKRGTEFQRWRQRLTIVFCVNADGSHKLPMKYIGKSVAPVCFRDHSTCVSRYSSQSNGWMDTEGFMAWIHWWYGEVKKVSNGPWLLIMDNCGGHVNVTLPGVRIEFLPKNCTSAYQPLDKGLISQSKIRYRSLLLSEIIDIISRMQSSNHSFKENSGRGRWGLREGQLPHVADAMRLMDQSWGSTTQSAIINCWMNSCCLPQTHIDTLKRIVGGHEELIDLTQTIPREDAVAIDTSRSVIAMSSIPDTPLNEFLNDLVDIETADDMLQALNSPAPLPGRLQMFTAEADIQTLFDTAVRESSHNQENIEVVPLFIQECDSAIKMLEVLQSQSSNLIADESFRNVLMKALDRANELRRNHSISQ